MEAAAREAPGGLQGQDSGAAGAGAIEGDAAVGEVLGADVEAGEAGMAGGAGLAGTGGEAGTDGTERRRMRCDAVGSNTCVGTGVSSGGRRGRTHPKVGGR